MENKNAIQTKSDTKAIKNFTKKRKFYLLQWLNDPAFEIVRARSIKDKHVELHTGKIVNIEVLDDDELKLSLQQGKIVSCSDDKAYLENIKKSMEEDFASKQEGINQTTAAQSKTDKPTSSPVSLNYNSPANSETIQQGKSTKPEKESKSNPIALQPSTSKSLGSSSILPKLSKPGPAKVREALKSLQMADTFAKKAPQILGLLSSLRQQYNKMNESLQTFEQNLDKSDSFDDTSDETSDDDSYDTVVDTSEGSSGEASDVDSGEGSDDPSNKPTENAAQQSTVNKPGSKSTPSPKSQNESASRNEISESTSSESEPEKIVMDSKGEEMVVIGSGGTLVPKYIMNHVDWSTHTMATRKLLMTLFPRRVLATHSLTGKSSPAFSNKPAKKCLDQIKVHDIVSLVAKRCNVTRGLVRSAITTKCADENKMLRMRQKNVAKQKSPSSQKKNNQENIPPTVEN